jgi:hypothetical protein
MNPKIFDDWGGRFHFIPNGMPKKRSFIENNHNK